MERILGFDFGNACVWTDPSFIKIERLYITSRYMWVCETPTRWQDESLEAPYRDYLFGREGEFRIGLPTGDYRLELLFLDEQKAWERFPVCFEVTEAHAPRFSGRLLCEEWVRPQKGEKVSLTVNLRHPGGVLAICFPEEYFINGMNVYGPAGTETEPMYPEMPPDTLPSLEEVKCREADCPGMFVRICDWFLRNRQPDGFIGDLEESKRLWYTASYPIRTLLAGYELYGREEYRDAAVHMLDLLVSEQMPEGSFTQSYRGTPTESLDEAALEQVRCGHWMNLADVGSIVASLAAACHYVKGERREKYISAVGRYIDDWASRFRQPCGGFTNGWIRRMDDKIYSVSTANTAISAALFYTVTAEERYLAMAESAALYLADHWNPDGRLWNHIFAGTFPGHDHYQGVNEFGDGFYTMEAIVTVLNISRRQEVQKRLFEVLRLWLFGSAGLFAIMGGRPWWELQNCWHNSKSAGNPLLIFEFLRFGGNFGMTDAERVLAEEKLRICLKFLTTPEYGLRIGVLCDDPVGCYPFKKHSVQGWQGCAAAAGGFAGIALAQIMRPGILFGRERVQDM